MTKKIIRPYSYAPCSLLLALPSRRSSQRKSRG